jgi:hypothetical protein
MRVLNYLSYSPDEVKYEETSDEVVTVPDQSYTVRELLENFTSNIPPTLNMYEDEGLFDESDEFGYDPIGDRDLDLVDLQQLRSEIDERIARQTAELTQKEKKSAKKEGILPEDASGGSSDSGQDLEGDSPS